MSEDSGKKLQTWAKVLFVLSVIGFIVLGIIEIVSIVRIGMDVEKGVFITIGTVVLEILAAWIGALGMTALGQTHERTAELERTVQEIRDMLKPQDGKDEKQEQIPEPLPKAEEPSDPVDSPEGVVCPVCQALNSKSARYCNKCGAYLIGRDVSKPTAPTPTPMQQPTPTQPNRTAPEKPQAPVANHKICPKCRRENPSEYLFCKHCGERLN